MKYYDEQYIDNKRPPDWMADWAAFLTEALDLGHLHITVEITPTPDGSDKNAAAAICDLKYLRATIEVAPNIPDGDFGRSVILHEFFHVVNARLETAANMLIELIPEDKRSIAVLIWENENEPNTEALARSNYERLYAAYKARTVPEVAAAAGAPPEAGETETEDDSNRSK